jgi:hypothetical protein
MSRKQEIIVDVSPEGNVKIDAVGYEGKACEQATKALEEALGVVTQKTKKPEYHREVRQQNQAKARG